MAHKTKNEWRTLSRETSSGEVHLNEYISSLNRSAKQSKTIDDKFEKYKRIFTSEYII